jgi:hypothetical protein
MDAGENQEITGVSGPGITVKPMALELPPPGVALNTVTLAMAALAISVAAMAAVSRMLLTKVVARLLPFHRTTEVETKLEPSTTSVNAPVPTMELDGPNAETTGTGLLTVKVAELEVPPPGAGLKTEMFVVPAPARSLARMAAVSWELLTKVVARSAPFQRTTDVERTFEPFTVKEKAWPPNVTVEGDIELTLGRGLLLSWLWPSAHPLKKTARSKLDTKRVAAFARMLHLAIRLAGDCLSDVDFPWTDT